METRAQYKLRKNGSASQQKEKIVLKELKVVVKRLSKEELLAHGVSIAYLLYDDFRFDVLVIYSR